MREKANTLTVQAQPQEKSSSSGDESKSSVAESPKGTGHGGGKAKRTTSRKVSNRFFMLFSELTVPWFIVYVIVDTDSQNTTKLQFAYTFTGEVYYSTQIQDQALHQWYDEKEQNSPSDTTTCCVKP